jgi:hypothetical protein
MLRARCGHIRRIIQGDSEKPQVFRLVTKAPQRFRAEQRDVPIQDQGRAACEETGLCLHYGMPGSKLWFLADEFDRRSGKRGGYHLTAMSVDNENAVRVEVPCPVQDMREHRRQADA